MLLPLIVSGKRIETNTFPVRSIFFPEYTVLAANAGSLDVSSAIGAVRRCEPPSRQERIAILLRGAEAFSINDEHTAHTVQMTGMPVQLVEKAITQIPDILRQVAETLEKRFASASVDAPFDLEPISHGYTKLLLPRKGFCYAITPGNDPRATALVAANLVYLGIPFVLRASIRDAVAPQVIAALLDAGIDPNFCQLLYADRTDPEFEGKHFKLVDAASMVWTFGPAESIDRTLRFEASEGGEDRDHFQGKQVLRHESGNCAAVVGGEFEDPTGEWLYESTAYSIVCTATKSVMALGDERWIREAADFLASLRTSDPRDPETQVGFSDPRYLDYLSDLLRKYRLDLVAYGGERLSSVQARPLLIASQHGAGEFFNQEIPAYTLAVRRCPDLITAVEAINGFTGETPRMAVSFHQVDKAQLADAIARVRAHTVLIDRPTSTLIPFLHEGNDYLLCLTRGKLLAS